MMVYKVLPFDETIFTQLATQAPSQTLGAKDGILTVSAALSCLQLSPKQEKARGEFKKRLRKEAGEVFTPHMARKILSKSPQIIQLYPGSKPLSEFFRQWASQDYAHFVTYVSHLLLSIGEDQEPTAWKEAIEQPILALVVEEILHLHGVDYTHGCTGDPHPLLVKLYSDVASKPVAYAIFRDVYRLLGACGIILVAEDEEHIPDGKTFTWRCPARAKTGLDVYRRMSTEERLYHGEYGFVHQLYSVAHNRDFLVSCSEGLWYKLEQARDRGFALDANSQSRFSVTGSMGELEGTNRYFLQKPGNWWDISVVRLRPSLVNGRYAYALPMPLNQQQMIDHFNADMWHGRNIGFYTDRFLQSFLELLALHQLFSESKEEPLPAGLSTVEVSLSMLESL